jgi:small-conductance mechanosensitive channel
MDYWELLRDETFWINTAIIVVGTLVGYWVLRALKTFAVGRLRKWGAHTHSTGYTIAVEVLGSTSRLLLFAIALLVAMKFVPMSPRWESMFSHSWFIILALQIAMWLDIAVQLWMKSLVLGAKPRNPVTTTILGIILRIVVWAMMGLSILANLGVNITAMVASLGVGGIAVALAVQTLLSDIFASLSIGLDKPFEVGDFVVFGDVAGSIEHIGLKTTRIRSLSGEQIVISNADLLRQQVHNYKRMEQRRIVFKFGVTYGTPVEKVRQIGSTVAEIIGGIANTRFDRAHFLAFDENQLTFEVVYFVLSSDYNQYMDIQQEINLQLMERLAAMEVGFALPTRRVEFIGGQLPEVKVAGVPQRSAANEERG